MSTKHPKPNNTTSSTATSPATKVPAGQGRAPSPSFNWVPWTAAIVGGLVALGVALTGYAYASQSQGMVKNVTIAGQNVGGLSTLAAISAVQTQWTAFTHGAFHFRLNQEDFPISVLASSASEDQVTLDLASLNISQAANQAYDFGHTGPWWRQAWQRLSGWLGRRHEFGRLALDTSTVRDELKQKTAAHNTMATNAGLTLTDGVVRALTPSENGQAIDYTTALRVATNRARRLDPTPITLKVVTVAPTIVSSPNLLSIAQTQVPAVAAKAPITLTLDDKQWTIAKEQFVRLLGFSRNSSGAIRISFDTKKTADYLNTIAKEINVLPQNAKLSLVNGKIQEFQTSVVGRTLETEATIANLEKNVIDGGQSTAALAVTETQPTTSTVPRNNLGITELVAEATTNFHGSPVNRRYNLTYGAKILNGLLIAPGETFSLVKALGPIDAAHGWKPELVIKGSDIKPEFGGGLCQVGTTMFRVSLNAGVPITERTNHSLRIRYYEPPVGLDATIYEPKPDFKFVNDYTHYLLLQTEVVDNDITFRFYGTKDGRTVDIPTPKVFNQTAIPATKNIEVDDLKPGQKECQTPGHPGADAIATYTVTKADGTKVVQVFKSHYKPLPVICRVGKSAPKPTPAPTS